MGAMGILGNILAPLAPLAPMGRSYAALLRYEAAHLHRSGRFASLRTRQGDDDDRSSTATTGR